VSGLDPIIRPKATAPPTRVKNGGSLNLTPITDIAAITMMKIRMVFIPYSICR
jgi:hypothetical protein